MFVDEDVGGTIFLRLSFQVIFATLSFTRVPFYFCYTLLQCCCCKLVIWWQYMKTLLSSLEFKLMISHIRTLIM